MSQNTKPPARPPSRKQFSVFGTPWPLDPPLLRIRLRYIAARFLQLPEPRMALRNTEEMLRWAQQMQDDGMPRSATELMRLAIEEDPTQRPLWLFSLVRAFEDDNAPEFAELSKAFAAQFPGDESLAGIDVMGEQILGGHGGHSPAGTMAAVKLSSALFQRNDGGQRSMHESLLAAIK